MASAQRILTVLGTRPEAIKLFPLLHALSGDTRFESVLCTSGQHADMVGPILDLAGIVPDYERSAMRHGQSLDHLLGQLIPAIGEVIDDARPDQVVVQGDTATALAGAVAAHHRKLPVVHVEAGLRSGDTGNPFPEETYRKALTAMATLHCAPTHAAADALLRENIDVDCVHVTGNTVIDALLWMSGRLAREPQLAAGLAELEKRFAGRRIIAVTSHRRENAGAGVEAICEGLRQLSARDDIAIVWPVHPNPVLGDLVESALGRIDNVALLGALDYPHFVRLLGLADIVLTDSGGVQEEAPALGKPILVMRETTERPEGVEAGTALLVGTAPDRIVAEATRLLDDESAHAAMARAHNPYGDGKAARRIVEIMAR